MESPTRAYGDGGLLDSTSDRPERFAIAPVTVSMMTVWRLARVAFGSIFRAVPDGR